EVASIAAPSADSVDTVAAKLMTVAMVSPSDALWSRSSSSCRARDSMLRSRATASAATSMAGAWTTTAASVAGASWPDGAGPAAISVSASITPAAVKASIELWSLRFMANVLLWVIGVVCNYNTMTREVNGFLQKNDPTEDIDGPHQRVEVFSLKINDLIEFMCWRPWLAGSIGPCRPRHGTEPPTPKARGVPARKR